MPFKNMWVVRVRSPGDFQSGTIRTKKITDGVSILTGRLKAAPNGQVVQSYRFADSRFKTRKLVTKWLTDNKVVAKSIEAPAKTNEQVEKFKAAIIANMLNS